LSSKEKAFIKNFGKSDDYLLENLKLGLFNEIMGNCNTLLRMAKLGVDRMHDRGHETVHSDGWRDRGLGRLHKNETTISAFKEFVTKKFQTGI